MQSGKGSGATAQAEQTDRSGERFMVTKTEESKSHVVDIVASDMASNKSATSSAPQDPEPKGIGIFSFSNEFSLLLL